MVNWRYERYKIEIEYVLYSCEFERLGLLLLSLYTPHRTKTPSVARLRFFNLIFLIVNV
jgi:hypothetical protein